MSIRINGVTYCCGCFVPYDGAGVCPACHALALLRARRSLPGGREVPGEYTGKHKEERYPFIHKERVPINDPVGLLESIRSRRSQARGDGQ